MRTALCGFTYNDAMRGCCLVRCFRRFNCIYEVKEILTSVLSGLLNI